MLKWTELYTRRQSLLISTVTCFHDCTRPHAALWPAMFCVWKLFHDTEAEMFFLPRAQNEDRDRWVLWLERPPGCIHPNGSELHYPLFLPSDQALSVETLSCKVRGQTNSPTPSSFSYTISSISVYHTLINFPFLCPLSLPPSFSDTLAYWSDWRRDH